MRYEVVLTIDWPALVWSGCLLGVLLLAVAARLRRTLATRRDLDGVRERLQMLQGLYLQTRGMAVGARSQLTAVDSRQQRLWEHVVEQVVDPVERLAGTLETVAETQAAQLRALEHAPRGRRARPGPAPCADPGLSPTLSGSGPPEGDSEDLRERA